MRRLAAIPLLLAFAALGSGALLYVHNHAHALHDAAAATGCDEHPAGVPGSHGDDDVPGGMPHDESDCFLHAGLNAPLLGTNAVPLLVLLGLFVAFLSLLSPPLASQRTPARLDCRGPPAASLLLS